MLSQIPVPYQVPYRTRYRTVPGTGTVLILRTRLIMCCVSFVRYMNHLQSLKFENKLYAMVKDKMEEMQQHNMSWIEARNTNQINLVSKI